MKTLVAFILVVVFVNYTFSQKIDSLLNRLEKTTDPVEKVDLNLEIAELAQWKGDYQRAINHAEVCVEKSYGIDDLQGRGICFNTMVAAYIRLADFEKALQFQDSALNVALQRSDKKDIAACYNNFGNILTMQSKYKPALEYHLDALTLSAEIEDIEGASASHTNTGNVYYYLKDFEQTIYHYSKAAKGYRKLGNIKNLMIIDINTGDVFLEKNDIDSALFYFNNVLSYHEEVGNPNLSAENYIKLGASYTRLQEFEKALKYLELARETKEQVEDINGLANVYLALGESHLGLKNYVKAENFLLLASEYAAMNQSLNFQSQANNLLSKVYAATNNHNSALKHYKEHIALKDSILNKETLEKIAELKEVYESEKKDAEIALLKRDTEIKNFEIAKQNSIVIGIIIIAILLIGLVVFIIGRQNAQYKLDNLNLELASLRSKMNPHFIFNSLNSIHHFIENNKRKEASEYLLKFSKLIRTILNNTLHEEITLNEELDALKRYIQIEALSINKKVDLILKTPKNIDLNNILIPSLILQPIIENAIWHGISKIDGSGEIKINIEQDKNKLILLISDNGKGFKAVHTKRHNSTSLGTKLTKQRINLVNKKYKTDCSISYKSSENGLLVKLELPLVENF